MKRFFIYLFILITIGQVHSKLTDEKRQDLLNRLTRKISLENLEELNQLEPNYESSSLKNGISYDPARIESIIKTYNFPEEYNFLTDTNATIHVKNQGSCACCWSHAATTALAYRYHKKGIEVDLSPQDGLSCYLRDCDSGNYLIDPQLNLIKNGTLTEGCLPFSSIDGVTMEECPTSCKDGSEFKRYYAQNAYTTQDYYSSETFEEIVLLIMDQLTTYGPVVTSIDTYEDFVNWHDDQQKCHDDVYTYDGQSEFVAGHAIVIVGYGYLNGKYYWLIQNSWGEDTCDKGFVKVEFGQINVENIAFAEPYLPNEGITPIEIPVTLAYLDSLCNIKVSTSSSFTDWKNTLDLNFQHSKGIKNFNYQCGTNVIPGKGTIINCYYEKMNYEAYKGTYEFKGSQSLGTENTFNLDNSFNGKYFNFWGFDTIKAYNKPYFIISEEGNRITFTYKSYEESILPPIYPNSTFSKALTNCKKLYSNFVYCDITEDELNYFGSISGKKTDPLAYDILCGYKKTFSYIYRFDKEVMAAFKIKKFYLPNSPQVSFNTILNILVKIDGYVDGYKKEDNSFMTFVNIEKNNKNSTYYMRCLIGKTSESGIESELNCSLSIKEREKVSYDNLYLLPYYMIDTISYPFQVIIKDTIKAYEKQQPDPDPDPEPGPEPEPEPEPEPTVVFSRYSKISYTFIVFLLFLF